MKLRNTIKTILKFALAIGLIYYLIQKGKLDFSLIKNTLQSPWLFIIIIGLFYLGSVTGTKRWSVILEALRYKKTSFLTLFPFNMIGYFFNLAVPGSVSGDIIKVMMVRKVIKDGPMPGLFFSIFVDRLVGLIGYMLICGITGIITYSKYVELFPRSATVYQLSVLFMLPCLAGIIVIYSSEKIQKKCLGLVKYVPISIIKNNVEIFEDFLKQLKRKFHILLLLSLVSQVASIFTFYWIGDLVYPGQLPLVLCLLVMPLGTLATSLPFTPGGLGIGHVAFERILNTFNITGGANYFNIYFIWFAIFELSGSLFYFYVNWKYRNVD